MSKYICSVCGFIYDEKLGYPEGGISPNTLWKDVPSSFVCPQCGATKYQFFKQDDEVSKKSKSKDTASSEIESDYTDMELSAIFSNLSKGCEKQYDKEMADLYNQLSLYYGKHKEPKSILDFDALKERLEDDNSNKIPNANKIAVAEADRGSMRALKWSGMVTRLINSHLKKLALNSPEYLKDYNVYVCEICGFIHIGKERPAICPVCKVPSFKMKQIKRGA
jgi:rubredoxin